MKSLDVALRFNQWGMESYLEKKERRAADQLALMVWERMKNYLDDME